MKFRQMSEDNELLGVCMEGRSRGENAERTRDEERSYFGKVLSCLFARH